MKPFHFESKGKRKKKVRFVLLIALVFFGLIGLYIYTLVSGISSKGKVLIASARSLKTSFEQNDLDQMQKNLDEFSKKYEEFKNAGKGLYVFSFIPYVADYKNGIEAGDYLLSAGQESLKSIAPYADLLGLKKGEVSFVEKSAEDRLQTAVVTLDKVLSKVDVISEDIRQAEIRIDKINPNRYPEKFGKTEVRSRIQNIKEQFSGLASLFVDAKPLVKQIPDMMGQNKEKTYLVLFQNDKELRATGGFLTAYTVFKVKNGKIRVERSKDIYTLDNSISVHPAAPKEILTYHKDVSKFYIRDSNLSPDFPASVELFQELYQKSGERVDYDGIIALDTKILVDLLRIFGDTEVRGIRFSAETDKRCDCPQVIYKLLDEIDRPVGYIKEDRKGILGDLMHALFYKAIGFSPSKYWGTLVQDMFKNLQEKHILVYFVDSDLQKSVEKLNFAGKMRAYDGDFVHINNVNFAGAKANLFVTESITSKTTTAGDKTTREVAIEYRNPYRHSDCNLERGGLCLNATLRNWVRVYVPKGSQLIDFKGSEKKVQTYDDLGKTVFEGFLRINPEGKAHAIVSYTIPKASVQNPYRILIQKQPGTYNQKLRIDLNGRNIFDGVLDVDREIKAR